MSPADPLRKIVLRVHGSLLFVVTTVNIVIIAVGYNTGRGLYGMLPDQPLGFGGLYQAYALMFVVGLALWFGSVTDRPRLFNVVGLLAHVPMVVGNLFFPRVFAEVAGGNVGAVSLPVHVVLGGAELFAILWKGRVAATVEAVG